MSNLTSTYDQAGDFYYHFVQQGLAQPQSMFHLAVNAVLELLGDIRGKAVCDVACGEGHLSRNLAQQGAIVTAVDLSENLLEHARQQSVGLPITFIRDDAQTLMALAPNAFQAAVCNLALMDIPDHVQTFHAIHRVLQAQGRFVFSVLHPCFETPYCVPESHLELDAADNFVGVVVRRYTSEGHWNSGGTGMRGTFGAHHRMLSTYLNSLLDAGFRLERFVEPKLPPGNYAELSQQINSKVPQVLVVSATKEI